jgi:integrase
MGKLAVVNCDTAKPAKDRDRLLGDGAGLFLRIRPHGTKTWLVEYEFNGTRRKYTVGVYDRNGATGESSIPAWLRSGRLSLAQARAIAEDWKAVRRAGRDPIGEWQATLEREAAEKAAADLAAKKEAEIPTLGLAIEQLMTRHISGKKSAPDIQYRLDRFAAALGTDRKIREVTKQDAIRALEAIAKGAFEGRTAKQLAGECLTQAKRLFRFAESREWVATSPIEKLQRKDFDARPVKRDVALRLDELAELWRAIDDPFRCRSDPVTVAALKLLILTGQREREVTDALWSEFDLDEGLWRIPASRTKKARAHLVHLAPLSVAVLKGLKETTGARKHAFASPLKPKQAVYGRSVNNALGTLFSRGELQNVTRCHVHDLRRTLITRLPDLGFEPFLAHKIANHQLPGVLAHYNHAEYLPQRKAALFAWSERIEALASSKKVVQMKRTA